MRYSAAPSIFAGPLRTLYGASMDERRKKLRFRAWRRGFREIDLILGGFADQFAVDFGAEDLAAFEGLLEAPDQLVYAWLVEAEPAPPEHDTPLLARIQAFVRSGVGAAERAKT
jgi:antitoxin CptB